MKQSRNSGQGQTEPVCVRWQYYRSYQQDSLETIVAEVKQNQSVFVDSITDRVTKPV